MPLTNKQYDTIMREYDRRQYQDYRLQCTRIDQIYEQIPRIREIDSEISACSLRQAERMIDQEPGAMKSLKDELALLKAEKEGLLLSAGYPADYLKMHYTCPECKDTGYIGRKKCHCFLKAIIDLFYTQSNLKGLLEQENFEHFNFDYYSSNYRDRLSGQNSRELATRAYQECMNFIHNFDTEHGNLLLFGNTGIGKTFLSHCIAKEVMDSLHSVLYLTASEFFDALLEKALTRNDESCLLYEQIHQCDLLIINDLVTERNRDFVVSQLFVCLNDRILNRKSTIISTNLTLEEIKTNYTERTFSRISNHYKILRLAGDDIRIQKKLMYREEH